MKSHQTFSWGISIWTTLVSLMVAPERKARRLHPPGNINVETIHQVEGSWPTDWPTDGHFHPVATLLAWPKGAQVHRLKNKSSSQTVSAAQTAWLILCSRYIDALLLTSSWCADFHNPEKPSEPFLRGALLESLFVTATKIEVVIIVFILLFREVDKIGPP